MKIVIEDKFLKIIDKEILRSGNVNSYKMSIEYDSFYNDRVLIIYFKHDDIKKIVNVGPDNIIDIPHEVLESVGDVCVGFYSPSPDGDKLKDRYCSNFARLTVIEGAYDKDATPTEELTPTILEKYLQEMKNFYNESLEEFNRNATNKTEEFNKNYEDKIKSYNDNSIQKTNEYNKNADEKIKEINNKVSDVEKIEENIEQIQKNVQASEQNAKDSEISAQNSAKKSSESESNIISIEKNINDLKKDIDNTKTQIDEKAKEVKNNSDIAIEQAKVATEQATLSGQNANKTSADKEDISQMKVSIEASEDNIEEIEKNVQAIKDDIEADKNETLEAKEEVENSLENERIESDKRYARAIDSEIVEINNYGQVECDNEGYMKDIEIESTLPEITQDVTETSPSLDYPSELKNIKKDLSIINNQENYFNTIQIANKNFSDGGLTVTTDENGIFTVNGTNSEQVQVNFNNLNFNVKQGQKLKLFKISGNISQSDNILYYINVLLWDNEYNTLALLNINNSNVNYTDIVNRIQVRFIVPSSTSSVTYDNFKFGIMVVDDESIESYVPYKGYSKEITLPENKFLGTFNSYKNYIKDNKLKSNLEIVEFDGTENWTEDISENRFGIYNISTLILSNSNQICTHFKTYNAYAQNINSFGVGSDYIRVHNDNNMTLEEWKAYLAQQKEAGTPLQILYISSNEEEIQLDDINLLLYKGINNISTEDLKLNFKYNVSIEKYIEENNANERRISDSKYPKALKMQIEDEQQTQIYVENDEVDELKIKGVELTQKTREGFNKLNIQDYTKNSPYVVSSSDSEIILQSVANVTYEQTIFFDNIDLKANIEYTLTALMQILSGSLFNMTGQIELYTSSKSWIKVITTGDINGYNKKVNFTVDEDGIYSIRFKLTSTGDTSSESFSINLSNFMIYEGIEDKPYEQYGATPSLDFPSEIQVAKEQNLSILRKNILDTTNIDRSSNGTTQKSKYDGGITLVGTCSSTWFSLIQQDFKVPIKAKSKLSLNYGKTVNLNRDNTFSPFIWLYNKNGTLFKTLNGNNSKSAYEVEQDIYMLKYGFEGLVVGKEYNEDIYIELEISDKQPTQFQKYEATDISITLENGFNGALKDYYNEIKKIDGKWFLLNKFAHYVLDGVSSGKKITSKQAKSNADKYNVFLGTNKIYIDVKKDYWNATLGVCNYLKNDISYGGVSSEDLSAIDRIAFWKSGQDQMSFSTEKDRFASIDEANAYLKQLYDAGNPLEFYVLMSEENYETIELPEDIQKALDKFKLYNDLNNIFIDKGNLSFKYNKSLLRAFEEQSELSASLLERVQALEAAQLSQVGGN